MQKSKIEWTDRTWNPVTGCTKVSQGCKNCYAEKIHERFNGKGSFKNVKERRERLGQPLKWKTPSKIFVNSMSDLFHEDVSFSFVNSVFEIMEKCPHHTFQILTKRPGRALKFFNWYFTDTLPNVWIGVSCEDQKTADERIPLLLQISANVRFLSCEPLLGPVDFIKSIQKFNDQFPAGDFIQWVIAGGESGDNARPVHPDWVRYLRDQCAVSKVPFFFKQWGEWIDNQNFPREHMLSNKKYKQHVFGNGYFSTEVWRLRKSKTGNTIDGKQHLEFPKI